MENEYYLGLDIGTDSVGYAVTTPEYTLKKFKGEPMWGVTLFDAAIGSEDRRAFRTSRRRLDRRQQRVQLLEELFAPEILKLDPQFFIRRRESALFPEDSLAGVQIFSGSGISDKEYHEKYPTIHHLIKELMESDTEHDIRLLYIACAWLVANRGHFLFDTPAENINDLLSFERVYQNFQEYLSKQGYSLPWSAEIPPKQICDILQAECGIGRKYDLLKATLFENSKPSKTGSESFPFNADAVIQLLAGKKIKPKDLFIDDTYSELESVSLTISDEDFIRIVSELGDDGELLTALRAMTDCAQLILSLNGTDGISAGKVAVYEQHKRDLRYLKKFVKQYCPEKYNEIFRNVVKPDKDGRGNYLSYSHNTKSLKHGTSDVKFVNKEGFCQFLQARLKGISVCNADKPAYDDMMQRLEARTFLPKQKDGDNRVIPQQLYRSELSAILTRASAYTPFFNKVGEDGLPVCEKILSIFDFRIPYFVGPLKPGHKNAWVERKPDGKILPWNFNDMVDFDKSEQAFIARMTNRCTYLPNESVLPEHSLLYEKFKVLNELNNLKVNGQRIPPEVKKSIYTDVFVNKKKINKYVRISLKKISEYLIQHGYMEKQDELSGMDQAVKSSLKSFHIFQNLLENGALSQSDVEDIVEHMAYSEDKSRMRKWLQTHYAALSPEDTAYILRQNLKGFGRLSSRFLTGLYGAEADSDGEAHTIMELLWSTNENLMQLLSERYTFTETIREVNASERDTRAHSLDERLSEMYVSNAVKRPIIRTLDVIRDIEKAMGCQPTKIFVEMARGGLPEQKGKRTQSRKEQLLKMYREIKTKEAIEFAEELEAMGVMAENRLQDRRLFLYYLQMGKCAYSGQPIDLSRLSDGTYNLDHIFPKSFVKDDSLLNNLVLVDSKLNKRKDNDYPVSADIQKKMQPYWWFLKENHLMTEEKYYRLTRTEKFSDDEKLRFINRQLVETRQSTKVITDLLQERFDHAEIVYVKAGMVSEFRQEFDMLKCRSVNDLHHAKDAYLNIIVGNVYHERFTKRWFSVNSEYNVQVKEIFTKRLAHEGTCYWRGNVDLAVVRKVMSKNAIHLTKYAFCRKGGLFDQQPVKKKAGLVPLKKGLPTEKYGGYNKPTVSFFVLARYAVKKKYEVLFVPILLMDANRFLKDPAYAKQRTAEMIEDITGKPPQNVELLLNGRPLKIDTVFSFDGLYMTLASKYDDQYNTFNAMAPLILDQSLQQYIKSMEAFQNKRKNNKAILPDEQHDKLSCEMNLVLYDALTKKLLAAPYCKMPGNQGALLAENKTRDRFESADLLSQLECLLSLISLLNGKSSSCDLSAVGGSKTAAKTKVSNKLTALAKKYSDIRIIDISAAGFFSKTSDNLIDLL